MIKNRYLDSLSESQERKSKAGALTCQQKIEFQLEYKTTETISNTTECLCDCLHGFIVVFFILKIRFIQTAFWSSGNLGVHCIRSMTWTSASIQFRRLCCRAISHHQMPRVLFYYGTFLRMSNRWITSTLITRNATNVCHGKEWCTWMLVSLSMQTTC